ncbi:VCBS repeat-containing protein [Pendulispora rubella]|uniref:VCBS repeat-containing protein n=1 Tax=Pendulispora rubella TaxID=2741070 RepID=A0ABZ2LB40_9BACT
MAKVVPALLASAMTLSCAGAKPPVKPRRPVVLTSAEPFHSIYLRQPSYETAMDGSFATGITYADINGDGMPDVVAANGNDMAPQPLMVYTNHCSPKQTSCFAPYPEWYSSDFDYQANVAVGDIDHDGWLDVAVCVPLDKSRRSQGGSVKIYMNRKGHLEGFPSQRIAEGYGTFACTLADVNADGLLDLVVAAFNSPPSSPVPAVVRGSLRSAPQGIRESARIYLNEGGRFHTASDWKSDNGMFAFSTVAADLDQDGWMDVAMGTERVFTYRGGAPTGKGVPIAPAPAWKSEPTRGLALSIDAGAMGRDPALTLAVSRGCIPGDSNCTSDFALFRPSTGPSPVWKSAPNQLAAMLLLADLNDDHLLDLVGGQWGDHVQGGPLWFFQGLPEGTFSSEPDFRTDGSGSAVAEALMVADTRCRAISERNVTLRTKGRGAVVTLPDRRVASIVSVVVAGRNLPPHEWAFAVGQNWISLARPYEPNTELRVTYRASPVQDLIVATWSPQRGNLLFDSFLPAQAKQQK